MVESQYRELSRALPAADTYHAVKANPYPAVIRTLIAAGACFDVASRAEIDLCLDLGAEPSRLSFGNTIKKREDIAYAQLRGVRLFACSPSTVRRNYANSPPSHRVPRCSAVC